MEGQIARTRKRFKAEQAVVSAKTSTRCSHFISKAQLIARGNLFSKAAYGQNLLKLAKEDQAALLAR
ncbi:hypothetical protein ASF60_18985 [Methylobacterium sp. Leaf113]|uniref:hypothetical protein n=1 Tax=Methylobacterium sp. Leaf113 TaxID=1736259 RepID=UPI0007013350|nr:hypothetical protein [Methylobacterium sp. Leaf113]KQP89807.1 hypothetical protein ASF60_18985 [Methylobacterium sp. Leaf113]